MSEERIITAAVVTSGEKSDGQELPKLLQMSQNNGMEVDAIIGDSAYSGKENLKITNDQNIKIVARLNSSITRGFRKDEEKFDYNKDADRFICPAGHLAIRKARQGKKNIGENQVYTYYFDVEKCKLYPLKEDCYKDGAKSKTYSVSRYNGYFRSQFEENTEVNVEKNNLCTSISKSVAVHLKLPLKKI